MGRKIVTCCYCGTRAALVFDEGLHELTCRACGAPLHDMKMMPQQAVKKDKTNKKQRGTPAVKYSDRRAATSEDMRSEWRDWPAKKRRKKKRKPVMGRVFEELWDVVEDILD